MGIRIQPAASRCLDTIHSICQSPRLKQYVVGITSKPSHYKATDYRRWTYDHLVVLVDHLTACDARELEGAVQNRIFCELDKRNRLYRRYDPRWRSRHYPSIGGVDPKSTLHVYSLYIAWEDKVIRAN